MKVPFKKWGLFQWLRRRHVPTTLIINTLQTHQWMEQYRKSPRAQFINYDVGNYFITICTYHRKHYFGEIYDDAMHLNKIGEFLESQLKDASKIVNYIEIPLYVVMPNHFHAIVCVNDSFHNENESIGYLQRSPDENFRKFSNHKRYVPALSRYINSLKGAVTKYAASIGCEFKWQGRYHDHAIRNNDDGNNISEYIVHNVAKWQEDCYNSENTEL